MLAKFADSRIVSALDDIGKSSANAIGLVRFPHLTLSSELN
jgi:hypothetical protein